MRILGCKSMKNKDFLQIFRCNKCNKTEYGQETDVTNVTKGCLR